MRNSIFCLSVALIATLSGLANAAAPVEKNTVPKKVMDTFYSRHANALEVSTKIDKHFNQEVIEVSFKENKDDKETFIELYRGNGHFFVNAARISISANSTLMPEEVKTNLKAAFDTYEISDAVLIPNPNASGEEFDLLIESNSKAWHVVIDRKGNIAMKVPVN